MQNSEIHGLTLAALEKAARLPIGPVDEKQPDLAGPPRVFEVVPGLASIISAILVPEPVPPYLRDALYRLVPDYYRLDFELMRRWKLWAVICGPDWAGEQKRRVPMTRPKNGMKLAFL